jgi:hypothetical protein
MRKRREIPLAFRVLRWPFFTCVGTHENSYYLHGQAECDIRIGSILHFEVSAKQSAMSAVRDRQDDGWLIRRFGSITDLPSSTPCPCRFLVSKGNNLDVRKFTCRYCVETLGTHNLNVGHPGALISHMLQKESLKERP